MYQVIIVNQNVDTLWGGGSRKNGPFISDLELLEILRYATFNGSTALISYFIKLMIIVNFSTSGQCWPIKPRPDLYMEIYQF